MAIGYAVAKCKSGEDRPLPQWAQEKACFVRKAPSLASLDGEPGGSELFEDDDDDHEASPSPLVIDPGRLAVRVWDLISSSCLLYTAAVVPFEVAFLPSPCSAAEPLFLCNRLVDLVFRLCFDHVDLGHYFIVKEINARGKMEYRVRPVHESTSGTTRRPTRCEVDHEDESMSMGAGSLYRHLGKMEC